MFKHSTQHIKNNNFNASPIHTLLLHVVARWLWYCTAQLCCAWVWKLVRSQGVATGLFRTRQGPGSILQCIGRSFPHNTELFCALHDFAILHVSIKPDYNCTDPESRSIYHKIPKKILFIFYRTLNLLECNECANQ